MHQLNFLCILHKKWLLKFSIKEFCHFFEGVGRFSPQTQLPIYFVKGVLLGRGEGVPKVYSKKISKEAIEDGEAIV